MHPAPRAPRALRLLPPAGRAPRAAGGDGVDDNAPLESGDWAAHLPVERREHRHIGQEPQAAHPNDVARCMACLACRTAEALEALHRTL